MIVSKDQSILPGRTAFLKECLDGKAETTITVARAAWRQAGSNGEGTPKPTLGPSLYQDGVVYRVLPCPREFEIHSVGNLPIAQIRIRPRRRPFHGHEVHPIDTQRDL